jgi:WD40 repeat protein
MLKTDAPGISAVAFSPDGRRLAALGTDNRLYIWSLGEEELALYLSVGVITRRAIVADRVNRNEQGSWLAWISDDRVAAAVESAAISVFEIEPDRWLRRINSLAQGAGRPID